MQSNNLCRRWKIAIALFFLTLSVIACATLEKYGELKVGEPPKTVILKGETTSIFRVNVVAGTQYKVSLQPTNSKTPNRLGFIHICPYESDACDQAVAKAFEDTSLTFTATKSGDVYILISGIPLDPGVLIGTYTVTLEKITP